MKVRVKIPEKLQRLVLTPKRLKLAIGGRSGGKSIAFGDVWLRKCEAGERLCCGREFQNSIDDSVHSQLRNRIATLQLQDYLHAEASRIRSHNGGEIFYRGLSRNVTGFKSTFGIKALWIEEAQTLSRDTIETVLPTIRSVPEDESAEDPDPPEIWMSANRKASNDDFAKAFLKPYEKYLSRYGFYEDDEIIIVEINYPDNPFFPPEMEQQRQRDKRIMPRARYDHVWEGKYSDTVDNAIIQPEWFDACVDAHVKLGWKPLGRETISHDPSDGGDAAAYVYRKGSVILAIDEMPEGTEINDAMDWATTAAEEIRADMFIWDGDGMGAGLRAQAKKALSGKQCQLSMFKGSLSPMNPNQVYQPIDGELKKAATNANTFSNQRAQFYWLLRDRMFKTYLAVERGEYQNPDEMISFSSSIELIDQLRAELCRIPRIPGGRIQIMSKPDMKSKLKLDSPNLADCVMMSESADYVAVQKSTSTDYDSRGNSAGWT
ncbi:MAG: PBSX family phage terminase large subunit [Gammaproteobacteria bacterium]|nr:PBSX family phage terminase large subunit [Gammaproteobacteria bacterium]MBJ54740.1 PBSX family phage terminase large subunit [Gammaproteobacteria bacterium]